MGSRQRIERIPEFTCPRCGGWTLDNSVCACPCPSHPSRLLFLTPNQKHVLKWVGGSDDMRLASAARLRALVVLSEKRLVEREGAEVRITKLGRAVLRNMHNTL